MSAEPSALDAELKQRMVGYLDHLEHAISKGGDFVAEQLPDVIHQMVAYRLAFAAVSMLAGIALVVLTCYAAKRIFQYTNSDGCGQFDREPIQMLTVTFGLFAAVGGIILAALNLNTVLMCWLVPKYFILQQILAMTKGG